MIVDKIMCITGGVQLVCGLWFLHEKQYVCATLALVVCAACLVEAFL